MQVELYHLTDSSVFEKMNTGMLPPRAYNLHKTTRNASIYIFQAIVDKRLLETSRTYYTYLWITGQNFNLKKRRTTVNQWHRRTTVSHIVKRIRSAVNKVCHRKTKIDVSHSDVIVPPDIPERFKDFLKASDEVYGYRKRASAWSSTQMTQTQNGTLHKHIYFQWL